MDGDPACAAVHRRLRGCPTFDHDLVEKAVEQLRRAARLASGERVPLARHALVEGLAERTAMPLIGRSGHDALAPFLPSRSALRAAFPACVAERSERTLGRKSCAFSAWGDCMRNLVAAGLVGIAVSAGGCASGYVTTAGLIRLDPGVNVPPTRGLVWSCPSDKGPDPAKAYPNCEGLPLPPSPAQADAERAARTKAQADMMAARAEGERIGARQCPSGKVLSLEKRVDFSTDSSELSDASKDTLKDVADSVKTDPKVTEIRITGAADSTGTTAKNEALSQERAAVVKDYLEQEGVPPVKIQTQAVGDSAPVASNDTTDGRALNRSAAVIVIANK